jgi:hypothetical protein
MEQFYSSWHDAICPEYPMGTTTSYGLAGALNLEDIPLKRRKGSMMWSGWRTRIGYVLPSRSEFELRSN